MSGNIDETFDENSFRDYYKAENSDDEENNNELLNQLYAEIYYPSNDEIELGANILSNAVPLSNCIVNESMNRQENIQYNFNNEVISESEVTREQDPAVEKFIQTNEKNLADQEISNIAEREPAAGEFIQINEKNLADQETKNTAEDRKKKKSPSKKHKSPKKPKNKHWERPQEDNIILVDESDMDTKYNVLHKNMKKEFQLDNIQKETSDDSDSESIFEVPIPPKPEPLLIDLQDSDDEDTGSSIDEDDLLEGRLYAKNAPKSNLRVLDSRVSSSPEVEILEEPLDHQNPANNYKFPRNRNRSIKSTRAYEIYEDFVLNCTKVQKGARSINEIRQSSKKATDAEQRIETSVEGTSLKKRPVQNVSEGNSSGDAYVSQEPCQTSEERGIETREQTKKTQQNVSNNETDDCMTLMYDLRHAVQTLENTLLEVSCGANNNLVMSQKRHSEGNSEEGGGDEGNGEGGKGKEGEETANDYPARKRQCTVQDDQFNVVPTLRSSDKRTKRNASFWNEYFFKPLPEALKKFYNDSRGQENFNIHEIQRDMSKDPRKWKILDEDLMPSPAFRRGRYWSGLRCTYCQRDGHLRKDCPEPPKIRCCTMCGKQGHVTWRCPQQVCLTCGKKQNTYRKNCEHCRTLYCIRCCSVGHKKEHCPDLWRRYHSVTREIGCAPQDPGNVMKPNSQLHCCNCSKRGHESSTCREYRWSTHFPTPAFVTSYTDGPVYESQNIPNRISLNINTPNVASFKTRSNRTPNQQMHDNTSITEAQEAPPSIDIGASSSSATTETNEETRVQNTQEQVMTISEVTMLKFANVIYCCGNLRSKKTRDARILVSNLSQHKELCLEARKFLTNKFSNGTVFPVFLKKLRKIAEFELIIGLLPGKSEVMSQLMARKDCVSQLFHLLLYWLNLPLTEKKYGLDLNIPLNNGKMCNLLTTLTRKMPKEIKDPLKLYHVMNMFKRKLQNMSKNKDKEYFHDQTCMWGIQTKLLAFINTYPEPSVHFRKIMSYADTLKCRAVGNQLDAASYLDILLSYNNIYTPHTPPNLRSILQRITKQQTGNMVQKVIQEQQLSSNVNINPSISPATSSSRTPQDTYILVNPFAVANAEKVPHNTSNVVEVEDVNICQPGTSNTVENQYSQDILPLDVEPVSIQIGNPQREDGQWPANNVNININLPLTEQSIVSTSNQSNKQKRSMPKKLTKHQENIKLKQRNLRIEMFRQQAEKVANEARAFQVPYIIKAAEDVLRKWKNKTLRKKDLRKVRKMMKMESKHQKLIKSMYNN